MTETTEIAYHNLVREAFIEPIRSVLIIDDDYPTWDEVLSQTDDNKEEEGTTSSKAWLSNSKPVLDLISHFRESRPALLVDIFDGQSSADIQNQPLAAHLHQSDMLVLDYELEGNGNGGNKSIGIIQSLLENDHFNLIVIHTNTQDLQVPFGEVALSLLKPCQKSEEEISDIGIGKQLIEEREDEDSTVAERIRNCFGVEQYMDVRKPSLGRGTTSMRKLMNGAAPFAQLKALIDDVGWDRQKPRQILCWAVDDFENSNKEKLGSNDHNGLTWTTDHSKPWIRTDRGFIAFANKQRDTELIDVLQGAIKRWEPTPSRLLSAKFRAEIDDKGVIAEDKSLSNRHVYAKFYHDLYQASDLERKSILEAHVGRYIEQLTAEINLNILRFGIDIVKADPNDDFSKHYKVDLSDAKEKRMACNQFNSYVSCKPVSGWHLSPGHIFEIDSELWVCVSPACDMVPDNSVSGIDAKDKSVRSFIAAKLHARKAGKQFEAYEINTNNFIFLNRNEGIEVFNINNQGDSPSPTWRIFIASDRGQLIDDKITITHFKGAGNEIQQTKLTVSVIGQLRYEYALNLVQKLGSNFTRVGLDFASS